MNLRRECIVNCRSSFQWNMKTIYVLFPCVCLYCTIRNYIMLTIPIMLSMPINNNDMVMMKIQLIIDTNKFICIKIMTGVS